MDIITHPSQFKNLRNHPLILSIGNFDGLHLGHQAVINRIKNLAGESGHCIALTFNNHPSEILSNFPRKRLISLDHKLYLLSQCGINTIILIDFSQDLSQYSAEEFIQFLFKSIPFTHLVLGYDARFGHNRSGTPDEILRLSKKYGFACEYVNAVQYEDVAISSSLVRNHIIQGNLEIVQKLLGRPFSVRGTVINGEGKGKQLGWPTANIQTSGLCLPPNGVYKVNVNFEQKKFIGIANLGVAPTQKDLKEPLLEVHILDFNETIYLQLIEVNFLNFIRVEKKFQDLDELKLQIHQDILSLNRL